MSDVSVTFDVTISKKTLEDMRGCLAEVAMFTSEMNYVQILKEFFCVTVDHDFRDKVKVVQLYER